MDDWKVLFICTGNTCRSPMAEAIFNHKWREQGVAKSAGLFAADGQNAARNTIEILKENGIECLHQSSMLHQEDMEWATHVLTMTYDHKDVVLNSYPAFANKIFTLKEFVGENDHSLDVVDPFGGDITVYQHLYKELDELISKIK